MQPKTYLTKTGKLAGRLEVAESQKTAEINKGGKVVFRAHYGISKDGKWVMYAFNAGGRKTADRRGTLSPNELTQLGGTLKKCDLLNMNNHQPGGTHSVYVYFGGLTKLLIADGLA